MPDEMEESSTLIADSTGPRWNDQSADPMSQEDVDRLLAGSSFRESATFVTGEKARRWDVPFGPQMTQDDVDRLLSIAPFKDIDRARFPAALSLEGILRNDTRIVHFEPGDIIVRDGDYGHSAFWILDGSVRVFLPTLDDSLEPELLGRGEREKKNWFRTVAQLWSTPDMPEVRQKSHGRGTKTRDKRRGTRIFLQDIPGIYDSDKTVLLGSGELFGELAALTRAPRNATVVAETKIELLEIRWQGLRDLLARADAIRDHINTIYRERALLLHLQETPAFSHLSRSDLEIVAAATEFETHGTFEWSQPFKSLSREDSAARLAREPIIAREGDYPNGLILIRSGFARLSRKLGNGEQTVAYLGKGQVYGLDETVHNWQGDNVIPLQQTLRAVGYVDILRVPTPIAERYVLPSIPREDLPGMVQQATVDITRTKVDRDAGKVEIELIEFLVENRYINGTAAMVIDKDRCTRCDDCVRACASTHNNNPRFIRHGVEHDHYMIANACMHCVDPVCMIGCPTGAIHRDSTQGHVVINDITCIGCQTCANSCPYHNIRMVQIRDKHGNFIRDESTNLPILKATKCDLCGDQLGGPACERACPHDALKRIDLQQPRELGRWFNR